LSQPLYMRRPEIPIATAAETTPQTHEAAEVDAEERSHAPQPMVAPRAQAGGFGVGGGSIAHGSLGSPMMAKRAYGSASQTVTVEASNADMAASGGSGVGGGIYRPTDAIGEGDVSTNAFDDFFEYALTQPVTIHKNESAMVPILQQELPAEHVTLWSENESTPLRAVWLENKSKLTLDSGSFSIFESGEFAGEGLLDPIHPGEKRLLSYAVDQAMHVKVTARKSDVKLHHVSIQKGVIIETYIDSSTVTYAATNSADVDRVVLLEHPRRGNGSGWTLEGDLKAAETSPNLYRFKLATAAHSTATLEVREHGPQYTTVNLSSNARQKDFLLQLVKDVPNAMTELKPVIDAEVALDDLDTKIAEATKTEETAQADEARDRENLTALKGNDAAKRFVDELNHAEDTLQGTRKQIADLQTQKQLAEEKLNALVSGVSFNWDVEKQ
jgi:hypothetical protein